MKMFYTNPSSQLIDYVQALFKKELRYVSSYNYAKFNTFLDYLEKNKLIEFEQELAPQVTKARVEPQVTKDPVGEEILTPSSRRSPGSTSSRVSHLTSKDSKIKLPTKDEFFAVDHFEPAKKHHSHQSHHFSKIYGRHGSNNNIKSDLSEPSGFLNAIINDHATSSTNQDTDTVRYPPNKAYKSDELSQSFSRRQRERDFSESPISNPASSASEPNESMNSEDHDSDSSPFSSGSSSSSPNSSHDDSPVDSNEDFPPSSSSQSSSASSGSSGSSPSNIDDDAPTSYDSFSGPSNSVNDDERHERGNSLDEDEHPSHHSTGSQSLPSRPPTLSYTSSRPYLSSFGPPIGSYRGLYSSGGLPPPGDSSPMAFPGGLGYRPITSSLTYPLISSASSSPFAGSYKAMSSEIFPSGPLTASKYRTYGSGSSSSSYAPSDESGSMFSPFSFDSFPSSSDTFGSPQNNFKSTGSSYNELMGLNNNWYLNQNQYLPLMMKQAGYPMMAGNYAMQYQTTTQAPEETTKEKETTGSKTKNRLRFNLNRLQAIRLNNLKLPSIFSWHKNSTTTTTPSSV